MEIQAYLERLNFHESTRVNNNVLYKLQKQHLLNVPFENLEMHYCKKVSLSINVIYQNSPLAVCLKHKIKL